MVHPSHSPVHRTDLGSLFHGDCLSILPAMPSESVDLVFADPPFNLGKSYASRIDDRLPEDRYLIWCRAWIDECVRLLKPGGSFFLYNLPKWNLALGSYLNERLTFRNWVAIEMTYSLPISGRLYPSHYSLLYYCKGQKPATFSPDRVPIITCPKCFRELKDYGGYKDKMNPAGVTLSDVWRDIPPVRHRKFKRREEANELSVKLLDRILRMASKPGEVILDPFGGSGTSYVVSEIQGRRWIGVELGPVGEIIKRVSPSNVSTERGYIEEFRKELNALFPPEVHSEREQRGIWVPGKIPKGRSRKAIDDGKSRQTELVLNEPHAGYGRVKRKTRSGVAAR